MRIRSLLLAVVPLLLMAADKDDAVAKELKKLEGSWKVVAAEKKGEPAPKDVIEKAPPFVFKGNKMLHKEKDKPAEEATIRLDPARKHMDFTYDRGGKQVVSKGHYKLDGDMLQICLGDEGKDRPAEFGGKEAILITLKREKP